MQIFTPKMLTYKEKLEFLESLRQSPIDLATADRTIGYARDNVLRRPVVEGLLRELTNLDAYISVMHSLLSDEEWAEVVSGYDTPIEGSHASLKEKIRVFLSAYGHLDRAICSFKTEEVLNVFRTSLLSNTKNVQFLLFRLCSRHPQTVFNFLFRLSQTNQGVFLPYLSSLIVRCRVDEDLKMRCVRGFIRHLRKLPRTRNLQCVSAHQSLLYICCFRKEAAAEARDVIDWVFGSGLARCMNRDIVDNFCRMFGYECKTFASYENSCLYFFPFDAPIFGEISNLVSDSYIHFKE